MSRDGRVKLMHCDKWLVLFLAMLLFVDVNYAVYFGRMDFVKSALFYLYNVLCVCILRGIGERGRRGLLQVFRCNILVQMGIYLLDMGRWHPEMRYMGTYNDPNQFGYAIFTSYCMVYCLSIKERKWTDWFCFLSALFLIYKSYSVAVLVAIVLLVVLEQYFLLRNGRSGNRRFYAVYLAAITSMGAALVCWMIAAVASPQMAMQNKMIERLQGKLQGDGSLLRSFLWDRNMLAVLDAPSYFLYGSGEGYTERFQNIGNSVLNGGEFHSVWVAVAYYYGIVGLIILCIWIYLNIKHADRRLIPMYIALFVAGLFLATQRQPVFWSLIAMGYYVGHGSRKGKVQCSQNDVENSTEGQRGHRNDRAREKDVGEGSRAFQGAGMGKKRDGVLRCLS